ncbi:pantoate--beta-alanine ligase [Novosphingobium sp.]|uniref:pantoate--beta-alanine ligase n=1 Tax=Novosphingobium sp. TaxID=1874826 RepID=UPI0025D3BD14|nr:pantoate--beta-alanine ligase [Novosphingobium sp.]
MQTVTSLDPLRNALTALRADGSIALVPTMGALHEGHLALVREARQRARHVVVSIFVNPRQFGVNEDLSRYPRQLERDSELLDAEGVSILWAPTAEVMYPIGYGTGVSVSGISDGLCGTARPGHFDGVSTVVLKLFNQVQPDVALFGEKDWQQLAVIRRMARDLDLTAPHADAIIGVATVREADGLALSSRNAYLAPGQRAQAATLPRAMDAAIAALRAGDEQQAVLAKLSHDLLTGGFASVDYAEVRDAGSLSTSLKGNDNHARLFVAARIGGTRLIDNKPV